MSNRLPVEVNPFRLIEQRRQLSGRLPSDQLPRLQELLAEAVGDFEVELDFTQSPGHLPMIEGRVTGQVALTCQRCLEPVRMDVDSGISVVVTASQTDRRPEEEGYELCIIENERLFLQNFIEDEILLSLPVVPKHEQCEAARPLYEVQSGDVIEDEPITSEEKQNPFDVLKDWKKTE